MLSFHTLALSFVLSFCQSMVFASADIFKRSLFLESIICSEYVHSIQ